MTKSYVTTFSIIGETMSEDAKILEDIGQYKYGFHDKEDYFFKSGKGLSREVVENISRMKGEPQWMLDFRLKALDHFLSAPHADLGSGYIRAELG